MNESERVEHSPSEPTGASIDAEIQDANSCMAIGAGLGAFGTGAGLLIGATCPICVVLAPALIGVGAVKRFAAGRKRRSQSRVPPGHSDESAA